MPKLRICWAYWTISVSKSNNNVFTIVRKWMTFSYYHSLDIMKVLELQLQSEYKDSTYQPYIHNVGQNKKKIHHSHNMAVFAVSIVWFWYCTWTFTQNNAFGQQVVFFMNDWIIFCIIEYRVTLPFLCNIVLYFLVIYPKAYFVNIDKIIFTYKSCVM